MGERSSELMVRSGLRSILPSANTLGKVYPEHRILVFFFFEIKGDLQENWSKFVSRRSLVRVLARPCPELYIRRGYIRWDRWYRNNLKEVKLSDGCREIENSYFYGKAKR